MVKNLEKFPPNRYFDLFREGLARGGKKNAGEKSYKFFREGYVLDIYTCEESDDFYVKARGATDRFVRVRIRII